MEAKTVVTLGTLAEGAALELFQAELEKVVRDVMDPNTDPEAVRQITLAVKFKPDEDREMAACVVTVKTKLAGLKGVKTQLYFGRESGQFVAVEHNPKQSMLFKKPELAPTPAPADGGPNAR